MGNGEALLGVVEHNRVSRGGSLEAWDISPGQPGSWILMREREGRRKPISLQELRLLSLQWYLLQTQPWDTWINKIPRDYSYPSREIGAW